jgi:2-polyprenyl-6-hydroxyphenyl methylase/3-demethylubiquinone-9 3-methyltransferase
MWSEGHYPAIAEVLMPVARALVDACAISAGQEVLDVAAGTGNVAVVAAEEGASVVASDLTPTLIDLGRARSAEAGLDIEWVEADAEALPFEDARFDCVTSTFGAMFAPRPEVVARELFRVVRPGNTVGMANWTPEGFQGQLFARRSRYGPALPEGVPAPGEWGREEVVQERFEGLAGTLSLERRTVPFEAESPEALWSFFEENAGPAVLARKMLPAERYGEMREDGLALIREWNKASDGSVVIDAEYLLVVARRRG